MMKRSSSLMRSLFFPVLLLFLGLLVACGPSWARPADASILVIGDSLSAGLGIDLDEGWVNLLQRRLEQQGYRYEVVNASVSGDTTAGGVARLPRALRAHHPTVVIIELGGNDGLQGKALSEIRANLSRLIALSQQAGARVLLLGIRLPPNYGPVYTAGFHQIYEDLARRYRVQLVPFLLEGVAGRNELMQADGLHPRADAQPRLLDNVWPRLVPLLARVPAVQR